MQNKIANKYTKYKKYTYICTKIHDMMEDISYKIIGCAVEVHRILGPGLLESLYQKALVRELQLQGFTIKTEVPIDIEYKGERLGDNLRIDILVNDSFILELKSVEEVKPIHKKQLLSYMRLLNIPVGLLINFNVSSLKEGITRLVNNYQG